jgi:plastocyanin
MAVFFSKRHVGLRASISVFLTALASSQTQTVTVTGIVSVVRTAALNPGKADHADAVIWIKSVTETAGPRPRAAHSRFRIAQQRKRFIPRVLAVPAGSVVDFPNLDPFFHNVFSMFDGKRFDLGLYEAGASHGVTFDRPGVCYVFCNIHPEMSAAVVVTDSPFYAISDKAGRFSIPNVPPGRYLVNVWHERGKPETGAGFPRQVTVSLENASIPAIRLVDAGQLPVPHKNKYGHDYESPNSPLPSYK